MSQAFVRESEEQWQHEVPPVLHALIVYLTRENNSIRVYEKRSFTDAETKQTIYEMSNGLNYTKDKNGSWTVV